MYVVHSCLLQADLEEAKSQENAKLQAALQEVQQQYKETKEILVQEREAAKKAAEIAPVIKEVPVIDTELMNKLRDENDKLKVRPEHKNYLNVFMFSRRHHFLLLFSSVSFCPCLCLSLFLPCYRLWSVLLKRRSMILRRSIKKQAKSVRIGSNRQWMPRLKSLT